MSWTEDDDERSFRVVVNDEEQYSIWPVERELPNGWSDIGVNGSKQDCLEHIDRTWTDMRPRSLREQHESAGRPQPGR